MLHRPWMIRRSADPNPACLHGTASNAPVMQLGHADAAHRLGVIAHQSGKVDQAIAYVRQAIAIDPNVAFYHANLGEMYRLAGRIAYTEVTYTTNIGGEYVHAVKAILGARLAL